MTNTEQKHTPGPLHISRVNDSTFNLLLKAIPGDVVCETDAIPEEEANARLLAASYNAFDSAAARLGLNAVELAERMQDGGIAEFIDALRLARSCMADCDVHTAMPEQAAKIDAVLATVGSA